MFWPLILLSFGSFSLCYLVARLRPLPISRGDSRVSGGWFLAKRHSVLLCRVSCIVGAVRKLLLWRSALLIFCPLALLLVRDGRLLLLDLQMALSAHVLVLLLRPLYILFLRRWSGFGVLWLMR